MCTVYASARSSASRVHTCVYVSIGRQKDQMCIEVSGLREEGRVKVGNRQAETEKHTSQVQRAERRNVPCV